MSTKPSYEEAARGNIERHLGDCFDGDDAPSADAIYDEVYTLAFDGAHDAGASDEAARAIAIVLAQSYANP
jgi:hypothetical protein